MIAEKKKIEAERKAQFLREKKERELEKQRKKKELAKVKRKKEEEKKAEANRIKLEKQKLIAEKKKEEAKKKALEAKLKKEKEIEEQLLKKELAEQKRLRKQIEKKEAEDLKILQAKMIAEKKKSEALAKLNLIKKEKEIKISDDLSKKGISYKILKEEKDLSLIKPKTESELISNKINEKIRLNEMAKKRDEEIRKRKYSSYNNQSEKYKEKSIDNTKYFFDENIANRLVLNDDTASSKVQIEKKELPKKIIAEEKYAKKSDKDKKLITALNSVQPIVKLKHKNFTQKTEIFYYQKDKVELDIKQMMKISEYVNAVKEKPIKIEIQPTYKVNNTNKRLLKSRLLLIRAHLIKLGISHNRIQIKTNNKGLTTDNDNDDEIILNFIEM